MRISKFRDFAVRGCDLVFSEMVRRKFRPPPGTPTILTYHRIALQNTRLSDLIEPGIQVDPETFANHLQIIKEMFKLVRLRDWPKTARRPPDKRNRFAAVTFVESRNMLRARLGKSFCDVFFYPNGNTSQLPEKHVRGCYSGAWTVTRGFNKPGEDPFRLTRICLHQDSTCSDTGFLSNLIRA